MKQIHRLITILCLIIGWSQTSNGAQRFEPTRPVNVPQYQRYEPTRPWNSSLSNNGDQAQSNRSPYRQEPTHPEKTVPSNIQYTPDLYQSPASSYPNFNYSDAQSAYNQYQQAESAYQTYHSYRGQRSADQRSRKSGNKIIKSAKLVLKPIKFTIKNAKTLLGLGFL